MMMVGRVTCGHEAVDGVRDSPRHVEMTSTSVAMLMRGLKAQCVVSCGCVKRHEEPGAFPAKEGWEVGLMTLKVSKRISHSF